VLRAIPIARDIATIPPCPAARASLAANNRRSLVKDWLKRLEASLDGSDVYHPVRIAAPADEARQFRDAFVAFLSASRFDCSGSGSNFGTRTLKLSRPVPSAFAPQSLLDGAIRPPGETGNPLRRCVLDP
jgi:hypothetical protein